MTKDQYIQDQERLFEREFGIHFSESELQFAKLFLNEALEGAWEGGYRKCCQEIFEEDEDLPKE